MSCCESYSGYSGFLDEFQKITTLALPVVGGLKGFTAGYNDSGFMGGIAGGLGGVASGFQSAAQAFQQPVKTATGISLPPTGAPTTVTGSSPYIVQQPVFPNYLQPVTVTPPTYVNPSVAMVAASPNTTFGVDNKTLMYAGLGFGALLTLVIILRR